MPKLKHKTSVAPRFRRDPETARGFRLNPSHKLMLKLCLHFRYVTSEIVGIAYERVAGQGRDHVKNELGRLWQAGYLESDFLPQPPGAGGGKRVYVLSTQGLQAIVDRDTVSPAEWRTARRSVYNRVRNIEIFQSSGRGNLEHSVLIAQLQLILNTGCQSDPKLLRFFGDQENRSFAVEARIPHPKNPKAWLSVRHFPDAVALMEWPGGKRGLVYFEIERSHRNHERSAGRFLAYREHLSGESLEKLKNRLDVAGAQLVMVGDTPERCQILRQQAEEAIGAFSRAERPMLVFWPSASWFETVRLIDKRRPDRPRERQILSDPVKILGAESAFALDQRLRPLFLLSRTAATMSAEQR
jgi:hypothetical protein